MIQLICGLMRLDGSPPDAGLLEAMASAMAGWGAGSDLPRRYAQATAGPVAMAAVRLGLPDGAEPAEAPALFAEGDGLTVADATIHAGADAPPAEHLARALSEAGPGGLGRVNGDFALARWADGALTLARDHFGARPLVYTHSPGRYLAFASSPRALLATGLAPGTLDDEVVASWLMQPAPPPGRTAYRAIQAVRPAHAVRITGDGPSARRYWRLDISDPLPFDSDPAELAAETRRLLDQAVRRRLPTSGPVGGSLSGGLDSSPVAVLAARALGAAGRRFYGYTFGEEDGSGDAALADLVAAVEPAITQVRLASPGFLGAWRHGIEPGTLLPLAPDHPEEAMLRHAAAKGVGVILSGWGGDQVVSYQGRGAELELARAGRLGHLARALAAEARATGVPARRLFVATVLSQAIPQRPREALRRWFGRATPFLTTMAERRALVAPHRRRRVLVEHWADSGDSHRIRRDGLDAWNLAARLDEFAWRGAHHGLVYAYPLLDLDLVAFSARIPGIFSRRAGLRRALYRQALEGVLPDAVRLDATKTSPFPREDQRTARDRPALLAILERWRENARIEEFVDLDHMEKALAAAGDPEAPPELAGCDLNAAFQVATLIESQGGGRG